jgi:hypothetical protein
MTRRDELLAFLAVALDNPDDLRQATNLLEDALAEARDDRPAPITGRRMEEMRQARQRDEDRRYQAAYDAMPNARASWPGPCPCECNRGQFCGGCGHAGCGGRR